MKARPQPSDDTLDITKLPSHIESQIIPSESLPPCETPFLHMWGGVFLTQLIFVVDKRLMEATFVRAGRTGNEGWKWLLGYLVDLGGVVGRVASALALMTPAPVPLPEVPMWVSQSKKRTILGT